MHSCLRKFVFVAATLVILAGCSSDSGDDRHIPPNATLDGLIPDPVPVGTVQFLHAKHYDLHDSSITAHLLTGLAIERKEEYGTLHKPTSVPQWAFGLGREELDAKLGNAFITEAERRLAGYYDDMFDHATVDTALQEAVQSFPHWSAVDTGTAQDFTGLRIEAITVSGAAATDEDANGDFETPQTQITLLMSLPAITLATPPLLNCTALLADTAAVEEHAAAAAVDFVPPASANWQYRLSLEAHFYVQNHDTPDELGQGHLTNAHVEAAARDFGLMVHLLDNIHALEIPSSDLSVSFVPTQELQERTLNVISGMAKATEDADCLRDVDAWLAGASVIFPEVTPRVLQGADAPVFLADRYNTAFDLLAGLPVESGISCLHDSSGNIVQVGDYLACDTPSGPVTLEALEDPLGMSSRTTPVAYRPVTPYERMERKAAAARQCATTLASDGEDLNLQSVDLRNPSWWWCNNGGLCSKRFGRGIRVCLSEIVIHNQVGDYWNVRWYQDAGKASVQTTIRGAAYVIRAAAAFYTGGMNWSGPAIEMATLAADVIDKISNDKKIAGWSLKAVGGSAGAFRLAKQMPADRIKSIKSAGYSFAIGMIVDLFAQAVQVTAVGWQDYADGSHCACGFQFKHPDWCS